MNRVTKPNDHKAALQTNTDKDRAKAETVIGPFSAEYLASKNLNSEMMGRLIRCFQGRYDPAKRASPEFRTKFANKRSPRRILSRNCRQREGRRALFVRNIGHRDD